MDASDVSSQDFLSSASSLHAAREQKSTRHLVVSDEKFTVIILPTKTEAYSEVKDRARRRRLLLMLAAAEAVQMTPLEVLNFCLSTRYISRPDLLAEMLHDQSPLRKTLLVCNLQPTMSGVEGAALLMTEHCNDKLVQFLRNYFLNVPTVKALRAARWSFVADIPTLYVLRCNKTDWEPLPRGRQYINSRSGRTVKCVRMTLRDVVQTKLDS